MRRTALLFLALSACTPAMADAINRPIVSISGGTCVSTECSNAMGTIAFSSATAVVTFSANTLCYTKPPICTLGPSPKTTTTTMRFSTAPSATGFQVSESTFNSGDTVSYICSPDYMQLPGACG